MVGLVLVSHSPRIAEGTAELVRQMAGEVEILAVGGDADRGFGTDPERIQGAREELTEDRGAAEVLVFMDLGSAVLSAETVLEMLSSETREKVRLVDAPFVEGAFAAGVVASAGSDADECVEAAMEARTESKLHGE
jgi:phosphoenolpyruvate---glycerone phosphotransferase subunit DhaM